jgi:LysM repeat protein
LSEPEPQSIFLITKQHFMKKYFFFFAALLLVCSKADAQKGYNERARKYVEDYADYAITEQIRSGIPAAVTLGQGILETEAGASELMVNANNHFGIKCKSDWTGPTYAHDDDAPGECFKKYDCALESYKDHSNLLKKNPRYAPLFSIPVTNYAKWSMTLRKCGYATSPTYGQKLIKIIEEFGLQHYTLQGQKKEVIADVMMAGKDQSGMKPAQPAIKPQVMTATTAATIETQPMQVIQAAYHEKVEDTPKPAKQVAEPKPVKIDTPAVVPKVEDRSPLSKVADSAEAFMSGEQEPTLAAAPPPDTSKITMVNGLKAIYVKKGEQLLSYAVKYNVRYAVLLEMNDFPDAPMPFDGYVYLQKKLTTGKNLKHTVKANENLLMISQLEALQLKRLMALNKLYPKEEPAVGTVLELQNTAVKKPELRTIATGPAHKQNAIGNMMDTTRRGNYITLNKQNGEAREADTTRTFIGSGTKTPAQTGRMQGVMRPKTDSNRPGTTVTKPVSRAEANKPAPDTVYSVDDPRDWNKMHWVSNDTARIASTAGKKTEHKTDDAELAKLKAELDQIVYSDGSSPTKGEGEAKPATSVAGTYYMVRKGDTAYSIAQSHNITVQQLLKWNNMEPQDIKAGKTIKVGE